MEQTKLNKQIMLLNEQITLENNDLTSVIGKLKKINNACKRKFDESVDLAISLDIKKNQNVSIRGSCNLPHGHGKKVKLLVFAEGKIGSFAESCGADTVGGIDLINQIKNNDTTLKLDANYCLAVDSITKELTKIAPMLSRKKLMPNKKDGTIIGDDENLLKEVIKNFKNNTVFFKNDKHGYINISIGKISFSETQLIENASAILNTINSLNKSPSAKVKFIKKIHLSTTMGVGIPVSY